MPRPPASSSRSQRVSPPLTPADHLPALDLDLHFSLWPVVNRPLLVIVLLAAVAIGACVSAHPRSQAFHGVQRGYASWYGPKFNGRLTASGEVFDMHALTAAHRTLPFGTWVEVTDLDNGRKITVRINDRGPFVRHRIIDLSYGAAQALGMIGPGTARVALRIVHGHPGSQPPIERISSYAVQLGAFRERSLAQALSDKLRPNYPSVQVTSDGVWNRVQIGPFADRDQATALARHLVADGLTALVVAEP